MGKKLYSDKELLNRLQEFAAELGRPPSQKEMNDSGPHAAATYATRFGSWNGALKTAGLETGTNDPNGRPPTPKQDLLVDLKAVAESVGEAPSERTYRQHGEYSVKTYCKRFSGWNSALQAAGLEPSVEINLSEETLITALQEFAEDLGQVPTSDEMDQNGPYTAGPYKRAFGTWNRALEKAGLGVHSAWGVSDENLIAELKRLNEELGHVPVRVRWKSGKMERIDLPEAVRFLERGSDSRWLRAERAVANSAGGFVDRIARPYRRVGPPADNE